MRPPAHIGRYPYNGRVPVSVRPVIENQGCPDDRHASLNILTPSGRDQANMAAPVIGAVNEEITLEASKAETKAFKKMLNGIIHMHA